MAGLGKTGINLVIMEPAMAAFNAAWTKLQAANATIDTCGTALIAALTGGVLAAFSEAFGNWQKNQKLLETDIGTLNASTKEFVGNYVELDASTASAFAAGAA